MDLRSFDLNSLVTFEALVAERSATGAARRLGITQSAVSHALTRLRRTLGDDLLVRTPQGWEPTARAVEVAAVVGNALSAIDQVLDRTSAFEPATAQRRFVLDVSDYVAPFLLPGLTRRLRAEAPAVQLDVQHFSAPPDRLAPDEVQVRVADGPARSDAVVRRLRLLEDDYVVLMSQEHGRAHRSLTLDDYLELAHIKVLPSALGTSVIDEALAARGLQRDIAVTVPSWFGLAGVVASTDLVVAVPRRWARDPSVSAGCVWHPLPLDSVGFAVDLCWRHRDHAEPGNQWIRSVILDVLVPSTDTVSR